MKPGFSADDDSTDSLWPLPPSSPPHTMTRSQSEWAFQMLLEEMSVPAGTSISPSSATDNVIVRSSPQIQSESSVAKPEEASSVEEMDPDHYQAVLKSKLELACAAVALRVGTVMPEDSSASSGIQKQVYPVGSQTQGPVAAQMSPAVSSVSDAPSLDTRKQRDIQSRLATSGSESDDSDGDDPDAGTVTTVNADPTDDKRARRKLSNRESARRSRRRKQERMSELDSQAVQLRGEHSTLLKRLGDMKQKFNTAVVDNRILNADIETLRAKVKMAEDTVKRMTGMNPPSLLIKPYNIPFARALLGSSQPNLNQTGMIPDQISENGSFASNTVVAVETSCNTFETLPPWDLEAQKNKPPE